MGHILNRLKNVLVSVIPCFIKGTNNNKIEYSVQRIKILAGTLLLFLSLFILAVGGINPVTAGESLDKRPLEMGESLYPDPRMAALYHQEQQMLQEAVRAYFEKAIAEGEIIGAGVSIVRGDSIVISAGYGERDARSGLPADGQTIFRLGSLSKGFAGVLAARLREEGKLDWGDRVIKYLPDFQLGDRKNTEKITLAHLLSHTSGAPYHSYTNLVEAGLPLQDIAPRFADVQPVSEPGHMYSYQNALFALSGEIVHRASGLQIDTALEELFFKPLEMCDTNMDHESLLAAENVALPHVKGRKNWLPARINDHYYNAIAAGGINATAEDMGKWMRFLLGHHPEIMDRGALQNAFTPFIEIPGRIKYYQRWPGHLSSHYGFGWRIHRFTETDSEDVKTIWHHGGSVNGFRNEIALFPESDMGICVLLNTNSRLAQRVIPDLYRIVSETRSQARSAFTGGTEMAFTTRIYGSGDK